MAGNQSAWRNRPVDLTKNTLSDGRDLSSGRKETDEEKKKKKKATVTYNRPVVGQDPADRPEGTATVTGVNSRAEAVEAYRADREKNQEKARQEYKSAIKQYQLKTGKTVDSPNAVTAEDRMWYRASNPTDTTLSDTTRKIVEARRNTKQKKQELEDYKQERKQTRATDWQNAYQKAQAETSAVTPMEGISDEDALIQQIQETNRKAQQNYNQKLNEKKAAVSQAEKEQNQATMEAGLDSISRLSEEGQKKLDEYNYRMDTASDPLATGLPELEDWFAENEHLDKDAVEKLAEVRRRETNAQKAAEQQQAAQEAADKHPIWNSTLTVPANLIGGSMASLGYLGEALNGTGQFTDLDPYNQGAQLQNWSGAVRGEVKQNIQGDGSNPLRAIAAGAYDVGMGMADTGARMALGTITGGGSWLGAGIAGANNFGSAMQSAASRGANADQALLYATASATVDALTEKIPLDNLINISTAKGGAGYILNFLRSMGIEGGQEAASQLASLFADAAIMRDKSERNLEVAQMMTMNPDMSLEEAQAIVDRETVNNILYSMTVSGLAGGFNSLVATTKYKLANRGENADVPEAGAQNSQEQPAQEAVEAPDSEKAAPLDGEQMARALADQAQPAGAADALAAARAQAEAERAAQTQAPTESEAAFDQAFDRVMNQENQTPAQESQTEAPKTDTDAEMDRRAKMALGMEAAPAQGAKATTDNPSTVPETVRQSQPAARAEDATPVSKVDFNYQRVNPANSYASVNDRSGKYTLYADGTIDDGGILGKASQMQGWKDSGLFALYDVTVNGKPVTESGDLPKGYYFAENVTKKPSINALGDNGAAGIAEKGKIELVDMDTHARNQNIGNQANESPVQPARVQPAEPKAQTQTASQKPQEIPAAQPEARKEQPAAQSTQQQPQAQSAQPVQQQPQAQATPQGMPQNTPQEAQGGAQRLETNGQAQTPGGYVPGAQASAEGDNVQRSRPGDVRPMEVPKTDQEGKRVTEFAGNAYGAQATPDSMAEEIKTLANDGSLSFDTRTNRQSLEQAADYIGKRGADTVRGEITARAASGKMDDGDIEKAMLLYTRYANDDSPKSQEAASEMMVALSSMANKTGRNLQMFGMMRKMTPEGQLMTVEKTVEQNVKRLQQRGKVKKDYVSDGVDAELEADYLKAAKKAKKATDPEAQKAAAKEMRAAEDAIYKAEAAKMPATFAAKWNAWRYMSMMGNVRTNVRNIEGNAAFVPYKVAKDKLGALAEKVLLPKDQRTKSLVQDADLLAWAKEDTKTDLVQDALQYTGLLGDDASTQKLEEGKRVFKNNALEGYRKLAEELPAKGDALFKNSYYARSLAGFLKARGISVDDITSGNVDQKILTEARNYSINEAMKATFNDANALSDFVSNMGRSEDSNPVAKVANAMMEGVLPFRRTPANIIVRFKDYSPIGLLQGVYDAARNVKAGKITAAGAIDEICAGVTGTGAMMLGYAMAKGMGGVKLTGSDVDEDEKRQGHQQYALEFSIGGQEYSYKIDWAAPANLPLFVGANVAKMLEDGGSDADVSAFSKFLTAGKGMFEPMLELSMLSSLNELLSSGKYTGESGLYQTATGMITSYLTQAVPTILRQADTASQKYAQTTYANSADPNIRELQRTAANLPFVGRAFKTDKVDAWGEKVDNGSAAVRAFNAFVNPGTLKKIQESPLEQEITRLNGIQESNVSPDSVPKVVSYTDTDGEYIEDLRLTDDQYEKWATTQGQTARRIQDDLVKNPDYQNLSDKQKAEALNLAKEYAKEQGKRAALAGYPETGESWMVGINGKEAAAIVDKVNAGTLQNAIAGLSEAMKNDWNTGNREKTLEEGYTAYEKMDAQTKARVAESVSGDTARYLEAREAGVSTTAYLKVLDAVKHADGTGNSATYRAITSASISESAMDKLMKAYMPDYDPDKPKSDKTELKYDYARKELGMTPAEYAQAYEIYQSFSNYGKGKAKKQRAALAEIYGEDMAKKLYKLYYGSFDVVDWWEDQR